MKSSKYIFILLAALSLSSCEKEIEVKVPPYTSKLVVNSINQVGEPATFQVSRSVGMTEYNYNKNLNLTNAKVLLYGDGVLVDSVAYDQVTGTYKGNHATVAGVTYKTVVAAPGYNDISAMSVAPSMVEMKNVTRIKQARLNGDGEMQDEIRITFDDPAAAGDYYILSFKMVNTATDTPVNLGCINTTEAAIESIYDENIDNTTCLSEGDIFFRDELFNGKTREMRFFILSSYLEKMSPDINLFIVLQHVPESYFRHRKTYLYASENSGNPFAEPSRVYTNVQDGYGVFGVLNADVKVLQ
jgi:hypothetical protein